jgi:3-phenylpropionate/trans-cinnamate dioxygenase ferredoxin subunit
MSRVCSLAGSFPGESTLVLAQVLLAMSNVDGELIALDDTCTHRDGSPSERLVEGCLIGRPLCGPGEPTRDGAATRELVAGDVLRVGIEPGVAHARERSGSSFRRGLGALPAGREVRSAGSEIPAYATGRTCPPAVTR